MLHAKRTAGAHKQGNEGQSHRHGQPASISASLGPADQIPVCPCAHSQPGSRGPGWKGSPPDSRAQALGAAVTRKGMSARARPRRAGGTAGYPPRPRRTCCQTGRGRSAAPRRPPAVRDTVGSLGRALHWAPGPRSPGPREGRLGKGRRWARHRRGSRGRKLKGAQLGPAGGEAPRGGMSFSGCPPTPTTPPPPPGTSQGS